MRQRLGHASTVVCHLYVLPTYMSWFGIHCGALIATYMSWFPGGEAAQDFRLYVLVWSLGRLEWEKSRQRRENFPRITKIYDFHLYVLPTYMSWFGATAVHCHLYVLDI